MLFRSESLELRLATEELWARLCGTMAPAALSQSLANLRRRIAEEHQAAAVHLEEQRGELTQLADQLSNRQDDLARRRSDLEQWTIAQQRVIEAQAERLAAKESELATGSAQLARRLEQWRAERQEHGQKLRAVTRQRRAA